MKAADLLALIPANLLHKPPEKGAAGRRGLHVVEAPGGFYLMSLNADGQPVRFRKIDREWMRTTLRAELAALGAQGKAAAKVAEEALTAQLDVLGSSSESERRVQGARSRLSSIERSLSSAPISAADANIEPPTNVQSRFVESLDPDRPIPKSSELVTPKGGVGKLPPNGMTWVSWPPPTRTIVFSERALASIDGMRPDEVVVSYRMSQQEIDALNALPSGAKPPYFEKLPAAARVANDLRITVFDFNKPLFASGAAEHFKKTVRYLEVVTQEILQSGTVKGVRLGLRPIGQITVTALDYYADAVKLAFGAGGVTKVVRDLMSALPGGAASAGAENRLTSVTATFDASGKLDPSGVRVRAAQALIKELRPFAEAAMQTLGPAVAKLLKSGTP